MSSRQPTHYSIDSSALIFAWHEAYPPESFGSFWERLDRLVRDQRALVSEEVYEEIRRKDDGLFEWLNQHGDLVIPHSDEIQAQVSRILTSHPLLIKANKSSSAGDPFVIAIALDRGCAVVTQEGPGSPTKPKIPEVCQAYGVVCHPLRDLIREQGWRF